MTTSSRPIFCLDKEPKLIWNEVSDALSYKFRLVNRKTSEEMWTMEVSNPQCKNGTCQYDYPQGKEGLEPLVSYLLTAEANNGKSLKEFKSEVMLLKENDQNAYQTMEDLLEKKGIKELKEQWLSVKQAFGNGTAPDSWRRGSYIGVSFS